MPTRGMVLASIRQGLANSALGTTADHGSVTLPEMSLLLIAGSFTLLLAYLLIRRYSNKAN